MTKGRGKGRQRRTRRYSPRLLVAGEGKTEYDYLSRFGQVYKSGGGPCLEVLDLNDNDPRRVVKKLIDRIETEKRQNIYDPREGDKAYVLLDVEPHDSSKLDGLRQAICRAENHGIEVLLSNPCFEFWLLCHYVGNAKACKTMNAPGVVEKALTKAGGPSKANLLRNPRLFKDMVEKAELAVSVAKHVHEVHHGGAPDLTVKNPATGVYKLVELFIPRERRP